MLHVVDLVRQFEVAAVQGYQAQTTKEGLLMVSGVGQRDTAALHEIRKRCRADLAAHAADRGLGHPRGLSGAGRPRQPLRDGGKHLLVGGLRVQTQRHAVVHAGHGREAAQALRVAPVRIQYGVHLFGGNHPRQETGA